MINSTVKRQAPRYRKDFDAARPFRHLVIDSFFEPEKARQLLDDFPPFHADNARNEFGEVGGKAVVTDIARISPFYAGVYGYISSREFLGFISQLTGIPDLIHDEQMFGGGTHENLEGQELDPHVDFNFIEDRKLHRRLNLLLYLNTEWDETWGGCLELHSNPRRPKENLIKVVGLRFNRCVIFETSEHSWHGFEKIQLPEGKKRLSRKLLSIYLYTRERPATEVVPPHGTFYTQRPLPKGIAAGGALTPNDLRAIETLLQRRDSWIEYYQKKELADSGRIQQYIEHIGTLNRRIEELESYLRPFRRLRAFLPRRKPAALAESAMPAPPPSPEQLPEKTQPPAETTGSGAAPPVPVAGFVEQEGVAEGLWWDGWTASPFLVSLRTREPVCGLEIDGYLGAPHAAVQLRVEANGKARDFTIRPEGFFTLRMSCELATGDPLTLRLSSDATFSPARAGISEDARELMIHLREVRLLHPALAELMHFGER